MSHECLIEIHEIFYITNTFLATKNRQCKIVVLLAQSIVHYQLKKINGVTFWHE